MFYISPLAKRIMTSLNTAILVALAACAPAATTGDGPAPTLTQMAMTPATATVQVGGTQSFYVSGVWSDGGTTAPAVDYTATGGTITSAG